jgi:hypothetical protein
MPTPNLHTGGAVIEPVHAFPARARNDGGPGVIVRRDRRIPDGQRTEHA